MWQRGEVGVYGRSPISRSPHPAFSLQWLVKRRPSFRSTIRPVPPHVRVVPTTNERPHQGRTLSNDPLTLWVAVADIESETRQVRQLRDLSCRLRGDVRGGNILLAGCNEGQPVQGTKIRCRENRTQSTVRQIGGEKVEAAQ